MIHILFHDAIIRWEVLMEKKNHDHGFYARSHDQYDNHEGHSYDHFDFIITR
jgi:hypothetical protein